MSPRTTLAQEVARVGRTPLKRLAQEVARCRADQRDAVVCRTLDDLVIDPARARSRITEALRTCWDALLAPHWPRIKDLLDADVAHQSRRLADRGLIGLLGGLHPGVRWRDGDVEVGWRRREVEELRTLDGAGLVLLPSAFVWPQALAILDPPWQPTIVYPARGVGELWERRTPAASSGLVAVVGPTRARLLTELATPASTLMLARRLGLAASTLSRHLHVLHDAGLVTAHRDRHQVFYRRTALGAALCAGGARRTAR